jgi:Trk-type K+ transport system membrane component
MFIGRIGTLTLFYSLSRPKKTNNYKYPKAQLMVG